MGDVYEEVEIEDMVYDRATQTFTYPCPCGDKFSISLEELHDGEDIALCPSCTLRVRVIYDEESLPPLNDPNNDEEDSAKVDSKDLEVVAPNGVDSLSIEVGDLNLSTNKQNEGTELS
jgi:diphthamide biosynthesis protein 3